MTAFDLRRLASHAMLAHVEHRAEIGSTNDLAHEFITRGELPSMTLILAEKQTAGRGRGANRWWSGDGALTFSLVLQSEAAGLPPERWPQVSLAAAVAICTALEELTTQRRMQVKWPNDVYCEGRKLAGILVEAPAPAAALPTSKVARHLVIGIGINVNNSWAGAPEELRNIGVALCDLTGLAHDPTDVLWRVLDELESCLAQLRAGDSRLAQLWQERSLLVGRDVTIESGERTTSGRCLGIDADGALILQTDDGERRMFGGVVRSFA